MPRIHQKAAEYADGDFQKEVRRCQGEQNLMSVRALAGRVDMPHATLGCKLKEPVKITVADFRKLVPVLKLSPVTVLALLGFPQDVLKKVKECLE